VAEQRLGWRAQTTLEDGIRNTASWLRQWMDRYKADVYSV
jgi:nucleoside-diphosphate-sugar epimerase